MADASAALAETNCFCACRTAGAESIAVLEFTEAPAAAEAASAPAGVPLALLPLLEAPPAFPLLEAPPAFPLLEAPPALLLLPPLPLLPLAPPPWPPPLPLLPSFFAQAAEIVSEPVSGSTDTGSASRAHAKKAADAKSTVRRRLRLLLNV